MRRCSVVPALVLAALLAGASGCSFVFVRGPGTRVGPTGAPACTRIPVAPVVDALFAGTALSVGVALAASGSGDTEGWTVPYQVVGGMMLFEGLVWTASAVYGFNKVHRCRAAVRRFGLPPAGAAVPRAAPPAR